MNYSVRFKDSPNCFIFKSECRTLKGVKQQLIKRGFNLSMLIRMGRFTPELEQYYKDNNYFFLRSYGKKQRKRKSNVN